jgi:long-subunit acyl-CoA synthetase (AMP-forming)
MKVRPNAAPLRSLPEGLRAQARQRPDAIALRHKRHGAWAQWRWRDLEAQTETAAAALLAAGFGAGDTLVLLTRPRVEAIVLTLAAQALGGIAAPLDPNAPAATQDALLAHLRAAFVFAETATEVTRVQAASLPQLLIYADTRGLRQAPAPCVHYETLLARSAGAAPPFQPGREALLFHRLSPEGEVQAQDQRHADLLGEADYLIRETGLCADDKALAARAFAAAGQARYLLAPWLVAGFTLNLPETDDTRDRDRRELEPSFVAGTAETYDRIGEWAWSALPSKGSLARGLVDWSLSRRRRGLGKALAALLVRGPLRRVLGYRRVRTAVLMGARPAARTTQLLEQLGIALRQWPEPAEWRAAVQSAQRHPQRPIPPIGLEQPA